MNKLIKILHLTYGSFITAFYFFVIFFPGILMTGLIKDKKKRLKFITPFWIGFGRIIMQPACLTKLEIIDKRTKEAQANIPTGLYIANHQSMMDIPVLLSKFVIPPIMKKEILKVPFFGLACKISMAIAVDRKDKKSRINVVRECQKRLLDGRAVQYYPEGTRSRLGHPKDYKDAKMKLAEFAYKNNIPVTAMSIKGTDTILNKYGFVNPFHSVKLYLAKAIEPKDFDDMEEFCEHCWSQVQENYKLL